MKNLLLITVGVLMATISLAQNQEINEIDVKAPKFQNEIYQSVNEFLNDNVEFPSRSKNAGLQGTEIVKFTVTKNGYIKDYEVVNSVSREIDEEVIRVLEATNGKWEPGNVNGNPVEMKTEILLAFFLHSEESMIRMAKQYKLKGNKLMYDKDKPEKAIKAYNQAAKMLPNEESILVARILCNYELEEFENAEQDYERLKDLTELSGKATESELFADLDSFVLNMRASLK
jgi:TonB family protein